MKELNRGVVLKHSFSQTVDLPRYQYWFTCSKCHRDIEKCCGCGKRFKKDELIVCFKSKHIHDSNVELLASGLIKEEK